MNLLPQVMTRQRIPAPPGGRDDIARGLPRGPSASPCSPALGIPRLASLSRLLSAVSRANLKFAGLPLASSRSATALGNRLHCSPLLQHSTFRSGMNKEISVQPRRQNVPSPGPPLRQGGRVLGVPFRPRVNPRNPQFHREARPRPGLPRRHQHASKITSPTLPAGRGSLRRTTASRRQVPVETGSGISRPFAPAPARSPTPFRRAGSGSER